MQRHKRCGFHPWVGKIPGERRVNPLQYSCLGNPTDRGALQATVHGVQRVGQNWAHRKAGSIPLCVCIYVCVCIHVYICIYRCISIYMHTHNLVYNTNSQLIGKDPDAGKDWRQKKTVTKDEMVGWHHRYNGHELGQTPGDGEGQARLACCSPWGHKELDMTWWLNNNMCVYVCI